jgi:ceramide glucosyltransferase
LCIQKLAESHPKVAVRIFRGGEVVGVNPKINNMTPAYRAAQYPLILVSDAGIKSK